MTESEENIASPCIRNCCLDDKDVCLGCFRSISEIIQWGTASRMEKEKILAAAKAREQRKGYR